MKRESGYYFIFPENEDFWDIAYYNCLSNKWCLSGVDQEFEDKDFVKINENQIIYEN